MEQVDVVVVGGGAAGLAAALQLGRSRRSVVVVDAGEPRNAPAEHMHGYLGHEGIAPGDFIARARAEVVAYGVDLVDGSVTTVTADSPSDGFRVELADGSHLSARRVLIAAGLVDELPDIPGLSEQWGRGVIHCPYCHGWEVRDQAIVIIATGVMATHQALLFRQLSDQVIVAEHEPGVVGDDDRALLTARGVTIEVGPVAEVLAEADVVHGIRLADGRDICAQAVVVGPRFVARTAPFEALGLAATPAPMGSGEVLEVDGRGATSVPGVFAAGNVVDPSQQVLQAAAAGSRVGAMINAELCHQEATAAAAAASSADGG